MYDSIAKEKKWGIKMSEKFVLMRGGGQRLMAKNILNFHFDYWYTSLMKFVECKIYNTEFQTSCRPKYMAAGVQFPFRMNSKVRALYFLIFSRFNSMSNRLNFFFPIQWRAQK